MSGVARDRAVINEIVGAIISGQQPVAEVQRLEPSIVNKWLSDTQRKLAALAKMAGCIGEPNGRGIDARTKRVGRGTQAQGRLVCGMGSKRAADGGDLKPGDRIDEAPVQRRRAEIA